MKTLHKFTCAYCGKYVDTYWEDQENGTTLGMYNDGDGDIVGDWVFHKKCWDKFIEENPPQRQDIVLNEKLLER